MCSARFRKDERRDRCRRHLLLESQPIGELPRCSRIDKRLCTWADGPTERGDRLSSALSHRPVDGTQLRHVWRDVRPVERSELNLGGVGGGG